MSVLRLRKSVVAVFVDNNGRVLVGERTKCRGEWQFPQGGVEEGETHDEAILRESFEETGTDLFEITLKSSAVTTYHFPKDLPSRVILQYSGQIQRWYSMRFLSGAKPCLELAKDDEFSDFKWVLPQEAIDSVIGWKKQAYIDGLTMLNLVGTQDR